jgi:hypothetical protein
MVPPVPVATDAPAGQEAAMITNRAVGVIIGPAMASLFVSTRPAAGAACLHDLSEPEMAADS